MNLQLRPGYKKTEVGVIPEDWAVKQMGEIGVLSKGKGLLKEDIKTSGTVPAIPYTALYTDFSEVLDYEQIKWFVDDTAQTIVLSEPCVLIASSSNMAENTGKASALTGNTPVAIGREVIVFRSSASASYISYLLSTSFYRKKTLVLARGTTIKHLYPATFVDYKISLPLIAEQRAIAEALSDTDSLIESLEQQLAKKRNLKQGTMQELLTGKKRLPGFNGKWEVKRLGELFEITSSKRVFQSEWKSEGVPFYRARELAVLGETGRVENELFITQAMYDSFKSAHGVPEAGDMLVTGVGTLGKVYVVTGEHDFYFKDGNIIWFKIHRSMSAEFLRQLYLTPVVMKQISDSSAGTTVGTYTISGAKKTEIPFPPIPEQIAIAAVLTDMDAEIAELETQLTKTHTLKQGMMHKLLTGEIRLL